MIDESEQIDSGVISTLLKVDAWFSSVQSSNPPVIATSMPGLTTCDVIEQFAQTFISDATGLERALLLKSLQEAFLYCIDLDTDLTSDEITTRLKQFADHHGKSTLIQQFLALYLSNSVLLDGSTSGRALAATYDMDHLERMCRAAVIIADAPDDFMDRSTAGTLIHNIHSRLDKLMRLAS